MAFHTEIIFIISINLARFNGLLIAVVTAYTKYVCVCVWECAGSKLFYFWICHKPVKMTATMKTFLTLITLGFFVRLAALRRKSRAKTKLTRKQRAEMCCGI